MAGRTQGDSRDNVALGVFLIAVAAFFVSGWFALAEFRSGVRFDPEKTITEWSERLDQQVTELLSRFSGGTIVSKADPARQAEKHLRQAIHFFRQNRMKEALEEAGKAVRLDPRDPNAHYWRGRIHIRNKDLDAALEEFRAAVTLKPDFRDAHDNLGWIHFRKNRPDEALSHLSRSIDLNRENAWAYYLRALVFQQKGEMGKALEDAKRACALKNQDGCRFYEQYRKQSGGGPA